MPGTPKVATDAATTFLLNELFDLQSDIVAAVSTVRVPPGPFHPPVLWMRTIPNRWLGTDRTTADHRGMTS